MPPAGQPGAAPASFEIVVPAHNEARRLPEGLGVKLVVETRPVVLRRPVDAHDKTPQVMIFSNGDLSAFAATLERDGGLRSVTLTQDDKGQVIEQPMVEQKP